MSSNLELEIIENMNIPGGKEIIDEYLNDKANKLLNDLDNQKKYKPFIIGIIIIGILCILLSLIDFFIKNQHLEEVKKFMFKLWDYSTWILFIVRLCSNVL